MNGLCGDSHAVVCSINKGGNWTESIDLCTNARTRAFADLRARVCDQYNQIHMNNGQCIPIWNQAWSDFVGNINFSRLCKREVDAYVRVSACARPRARGRERESECVYVRERRRDATHSSHLVIMITMAAILSQCILHRRLRSVRNTHKVNQLWRRRHCRRIGNLDAP